MTINANHRFGTGLLMTVLAAVGATQSIQGDTVATTNKEVDIRTPLGTLTMSNRVEESDVEMALYPGARLRPKSDADRNSSDVNFNAGSALFGLKLVVQKYESDDTKEAVLQFYERELAKYGKVVKSGAGKVSEDDVEGYEEQLKVGSDTDFRLVAVKTTGKGSSFALVRIRVKGAA